VLNAVSTLKVAGYAGTAEQLRGAMEVLVGEIRDREELPAPSNKGELLAAAARMMTKD
jgi:hypothetical protein